MTLSKFLRDYIYVPLGGNRRGEWIKSRNLMITFVLGGIWHGAGWTFIFWGFLHGAALVIQNFFSKKFSMPDWAGIALTFLWVNMAWVFFRAPSWPDAINVLSAMLGQPGLGGTQHPPETFTLINDYYFAPLWIIGVLLLFAKNTNELGDEFVPSQKLLWRTVFLVVVNLVFLNSVLDQEFLYFDF